MKILIKIGSSLINKNNHLNWELLKLKVAEISRLARGGHKIILVTSGAVACGMEIAQLDVRPKDTLKLQLLSGEGQIVLMKNYKELFDKESIRIAQILLTHHNFDTKEEHDTIMHIINSYLDQSIIPIINENDLINKEELEHNAIFSDNDILSAIVAKNLGVDLAVILTDVDGLYNSDPKNHSNPRLLSEVPAVDERILNIASENTNELGTGGMHSKVLAAKIMTQANIDVIVANGLLDLTDIISGKVNRTFFKAVNKI
jgi:glutamate 5-kinase